MVWIHTYEYFINGEHGIKSLTQFEFTTNITHKSNNTHKDRDIINYLPCYIMKTKCELGEMLAYRLQCWFYFQDTQIVTYEAICGGAFLMNVD